MRRTVLKLSIPLLAGIAMTLALAVLLSGGTPLNVKAAPPAAPGAQKPDNTNCMICHTQSDRIHTFSNGDTVSIYVDEQVFEQSVHADLACQTCHTNISGYPHPDNPAQSAREYTLEYKNSCNQCHPDQVAKVMDGAHQKLAEQGNPDTPVCADCHNPHAQQAIVMDAKGDPAPVENEKIAEICSKCHAGIVDEYKDSVHGQALYNEKNQDVPACQDCHGIHNMATARSVEFRLKSPQLCATCHTRKDIMDKYGISTDVLDTYVADFHGTTVTLFERTSPDMPTNKPVCYDCHGVHNIAATDDPQKGLQLRENIMVTCQKCHPDATENFPESWMSHYIASPTKFPLVFYVQWFYRLLIPGVLGAMALFVLLDAARRLGITRRNKSTSAKASKE